MKILVSVKRVEDPEIKIKVKPDGSGINTDQMKYVINPFDEIAVEEALRLKDSHGGEIVIVSIGSAECSQQIRTALAMGADRGVHVLTDDYLDPMAVSNVLAKVAAEESPDLIIMGKQGVDDDASQAGSLLAHKLDMGIATFAAKHESLESEEEKKKVPGITINDNEAQVVREVDGGLETVKLSLPGIITCDLRLNQPRYASLPGIMKAKRKEIKQKTPDELSVDITPKVKLMGLEEPTVRQAGIIVPDVATLVDKLQNEAKVL